MNFHSAFGFRHGGHQWVGLLRTGAAVGQLRAAETRPVKAVVPMQASTIWLVRIDESATTLQAQVLPGIAELNGIALSHLAIDAASGNGFTLYANYKEAPVGDFTVGANAYGEPASEVREHYSGMTVEALNHGQVFRYDWNGDFLSLRRFARPYDPGQASHGHTWLPINLELNGSGTHLYASFSGFRPRLVSKHIAQAYQDRLADMKSIGHVPPVLMRLDAFSMEPDERGDLGHLTYAEPMAFAIVDGETRDFLCTFSPELGLRIFLGDHLRTMICHAIAPELITWSDSHFRPEPAHLEFVRA